VHSKSEDRLRAERAGAIWHHDLINNELRAIEEASRTQSAEFAIQRAAEVQVYLNSLFCHPHASYHPH